MFGKSESLINTRQLADKLGISVATIERWRAQGEPELPPHIQLSSGAIRYNPLEVQFWLDSKTQKAKPKVSSGGTHESDI
jgi:predicted DNA-binding transcriptional regulator AlpA